ncbi:HDOD domain-containing protein [Vibrio makurazakiensis]|uniref:HDOD domain-containing protein n=1 Tax=Vibrio makurazakiensis TaxID=2910250 RepID=UPI003D0DDDA3
MFSNLIKKLFDDVMSKTELGQRIKSSFKVETHKKEFLSYLFDETEALGGEDKFISHVALKIEGFLLSPSDMLNELPVMPRSLITLVDELNNDEFDINVVMSTIESEPKMAAEVIKLANSARYYRGDKKVSDLKTAFMYMGSEGLTDGVIKSYVNNYVPPLNIYWNHFGDRIWHHSNQTALYARELLSSQCGGQSKSVAYLVGLILNLGVMIIFQLMIESFRHVNPTVPALIHLKN